MILNPVDDVKKINSYLTIDFSDFHKKVCSATSLPVMHNKIPYFYGNSFFFPLMLFIKGGVHSEVPIPQVIIPSAAYAGAIISFVLCPSELVKVSCL